MGIYCTLSAVAPQASRAEKSFSLEKSWHGLHYLLTGSVDEGEAPRNFLLCGGEPIDGDEESGQRRFSPEEALALQQLLDRITDEELWSNFDPDAMSEAGVYPEIWDEAEADLQAEYLGYFHGLKDLLRYASERRLGLQIDLG